MTAYFCKSLKSYHQSLTSDEKPTTNEGEEHYKPKILSEPSSTVLFSLTEHDMAVEHRLPLLLDLPPPPLLSVLHFVKHAGSRVRPGQNIVSVGKRLLVPDIVIILDKLRVSEQASLQHGLQQSQVDHVEEQQAQDGEIHDDGKLNGSRAPLLIFTLTA